MSSFIIVAAASLSLTLGVAGCNRPPTQITAPRISRRRRRPITRRRIRRRIHKLVPTWPPSPHELAVPTISRSRPIPLMIPMATTTLVTRTQVTVSRCSRHSSLHHNYRSIPSPIALVMAICGRPDTGAILIRATTGCWEHGPGRLKWAICGLRDTGDIPVAGIDTTTAIGARILVTMAASIMEMATQASAIRAGIGAGIDSTTTARSTM
jgi:hypothetical protein